MIIMFALRLVIFFLCQTTDSNRLVSIKKRIRIRVSQRGEEQLKRTKKKKKRNEKREKERQRKRVWNTGGKFVDVRLSKKCKVLYQFLGGQNNWHRRCLWNQTAFVTRATWFIASSVSIFFSLMEVSMWGGSTEIASYQRCMNQMYWKHDQTSTNIFNTFIQSVRTPKQ